MTVYVMCDSYVGVDREFPLEITVKPGSDDDDDDDDDDDSDDDDEEEDGMDVDGQ